MGRLNNFKNVGCVRNSWKICLLKPSFDGFFYGENIVKVLCISVFSAYFSPKTVCKEVSTKLSERTMSGLVKCIL